MRWFRLLLVMIGAKFRPKITPKDTLILPFCVWVTDIDVSIMNHAAIMTVFEMGRLDYMVRSGFFKMASARKWYFPTQAISVQYYRPLKMFQKGKIHTRVSFMDDKWIYVEQKIERDGKVIATCLVKNTVKKGRDTIHPSVLSEALQIEDPPIEKYKLIKAHELEVAQMDERLIDDWIE